MRFFRADAAFAIPDLYEMLEAEDYFHTIRLKGNNVPQEKVAHLLKRPVGRPPNFMRRFYHDFEYQAASWDKARRVIARVEWHPGELFPRVGLVVTNLPMAPEDVIRFYNQRGTAGQHIKQGKHAINWTRLSRKRLCDNQVRLQLHALGCNPGSFLQRADLPEEVAETGRSPVFKAVLSRSGQDRVKIGSRSGPALCAMRAPSPSNWPRLLCLVASSDKSSRRPATSNRPRGLHDAQNRLDICVLRNEKDPKLPGQPICGRSIGQQRQGPRQWASPALNCGAKSTNVASKQQHLGNVG